ncbi:unnamed protein product [Cyprideis torosa]|uniref:Torsin-1A C-terminal domain-containing protein n=1 Tax=Cyprideis torosa TaxID=163714 RepID=A0A7R8WQW8_9CRUS|nr:unnamed protein product [Cyprideis torosa]CAG0903158.1 unnamed protein product [Cyprideis torosa]
MGLAAQCVCSARSSSHPPPREPAPSRVTLTSSDDAEGDVHGSYDAEVNPKLRSSLKYEVEGQHIVAEILPSVLQNHVTNEKPSRALTLIFHGSTGTGKNYVADRVVEAMFRDGLNSKYYHKYLGYHHASRGEAFLRNFVESAVKACPRALFVFDELELVPEGLLDRLSTYVQGHDKVEGVSYRQATFIFLVNSGHKHIVETTVQAFRDGRDRRSITYKSLEEKLHNESFVESGAFQFSHLLSNHLVSYSFPFLPLERNHVRGCIRREFKKQNDGEFQEEDVEEVMDYMSFMPSDIQQFSETGCKRVREMVELWLIERRAT